MLAHPTGSASKLYDRANHSDGAVRTLVQVDATIAGRAVVAPDAEPCLCTSGLEGWNVIGAVASWGANLGSGWGRFGVYVESVSRR
jgi:hypothetical protein